MVDRKQQFQLMLGATLSLSLCCLLGCGSSPTLVTSPGLTVADTGNNRVLIYNNAVGQTASATAVLGQVDFTHASANGGAGSPRANTLNSPSSVAKDSSGNLYVADTGNDRILIFKPPFATGMSASIVIGQPTFGVRTPVIGPGATASGMGSPFAVVVDGNGNLWVGDVSNQRVLEYTPPFTNGMAATLAIGQSQTGAATLCYQKGPTASTLCSPYVLAFDPAGNLWISDTDNFRVLEFRPPFSTGMAASVELGQPASTAFTSGTSLGVSANSVGGPAGLTFDTNGNLWLADLNFNRVLEFTPPFTSGMSATRVLGQPDFNQGAANQGASNPAANSLSHPWGLAFDTGGNLTISDLNNSRLLVFAPPFTTDANASKVIGQPDLTTGSENRGAGNPKADTLSRPSTSLTF